MFAWIFSLLTFIVPQLLSWSIFRTCIVKLVQSMSYKQGSGPNIDNLRKSNWREYIYIYGKNKNKNKKNICCNVDIKIFGDYGYLNTSKLLIEQGIMCITKK